MRWMQSVGMLRWVGFIRDFLSIVGRSSDFPHWDDSNLLRQEA
jgi:hypothetical protein